MHPQCPYCKQENQSRTGRLLRFLAYSKTYLTIFPFFCFMTYAVELNGKVVGVHDGDSITLLDAEKNQYKIRLQHIDAPELKQPFGKKSKQTLSALVYGKQIMTNCPKKHFKRYICDVMVGGIDVQAEMVKRGAAWVYPKYNKRNDLPVLQGKARRAKIGIWALPSTNWTPPWIWRKDRKSKK